jgi:hypothetical protein
LYKQAKKEVFMTIHPISPALYIVGVATLFITLFGYLIGAPFFDPVLAIVTFLLCQELSKFVAEYTMRDDDGTNSN